MRASPPPADVPVRRVGSSRERIVGAAASVALSDRRIALAGITEASRDYLFIRDRPTRGQIIACVSGRGMVLVGGDWVACTPGSFYLAPIGARHGYGSAAARWGICWVTYDGGIVRVASPCLIRADAAPLLASITGLHDEARGASDPTILRQWTDLVHAQVVRVLALSPEASRLWPIWRACDDDLARAWTLGELAAIGGMSSEHLRRLSHAELGRSPMRQLAHLRLRAAATALAVEDASIEDVCRRSGYRSAFAFSAAFKRATGASPSAYRALLRCGRAPRVPFTSGR